MDGSRFDQIARGMATGSSRRTLLKGLGGGVLAALGLALAGGGANAKPKDDDKDDQKGCKKAGINCKRDDQCCDGLVCEAGACTSGCRIDGAFVAPAASPPGNLCQSCQPGTSTTAWSNTDCSSFACDPVTGTCFSSCDGDEACVPGAHCAFVQSGFVRVCCPAEDFCEIGEVCGDPGRSPTSTCCPASGDWCECFISSDPGQEGFMCCDPADLCGPVGADTCCHNDEICVDGDCCHFTFVYDEGCCDRPSCNGKCCEHGTECVNDTCVPEGRTCDPAASENPNCFAEEVCSFDNVCCTQDRVFEVTEDIDGVPTVLKICCPYGQGPSVQSDLGCCSAPDFCGTSRGFRIRP